MAAACGSPLCGVLALGALCPSPAVRSAGVYVAGLGRAMSGDDIGLVHERSSCRDGAVPRAPSFVAAEFGRRPPAGSWQPEGRARVQAAIYSVSPGGAPVGSHGGLEARWARADEQAILRAFLCDAPSGL